MAAGFMPAILEAGGLWGTPCALCGEPIVTDQRYFQRDRWRLLGHMLCVLERGDEWDALPDD